MREIDADDADRRAPPRADPDAALRVGPCRIVGVARVEEQRGAVVSDDSELELRARDQKITPADAFARVVERPEILIAVAAHAAVSAREESLRRRQPCELIGADGAVLAAQKHAHALTQRAHDVAARMQAAERRAGAERVAADAHVHRPGVAASREDRVIGPLARELPTG